MDNLPPSICKYCSQEIKDGEARYTRWEPDEFCHYDCFAAANPDHKALTAATFQSTLEEMEQSASKMSSAFDQLYESLTGRKKVLPKKRLPFGQSANSIRLAEMLSEVFTAIYEEPIKVDPANFWIQDPAYRGPKWDLALWGGWAYWKLPEKGSSGIKINFSSWDSTTKLLKVGRISATSEGCHSFDVHAFTELQPSPDQYRGTRKRRVD